MNLKMETLARSFSSQALQHAAVNLTPLYSLSLQYSGKCWNTTLIILSAVHVRLAYTPQGEAAAIRELSVGLMLIMESKCGLGRGPLLS